MPRNERQTSSDSDIEAEENAPSSTNEDQMNQTIDSTIESTGVGIGGTSNREASVAALEEDSRMTPEDNLNKMFVELGGGSRFQFLSYAIIGLAINSTGFWAYPLGYFI